MRIFKQMVLDPILSVKDTLENFSSGKRITPDMEALRTTSDTDLLFQVWNGKGEDLSMFTRGYIALIGEQALRQSLKDALEAYGSAQEISKETQKKRLSAQNSAI